MKRCTLLILMTVALAGCQNHEQVETSTMPEMPVMARSGDGVIRAPEAVYVDTQQEFSFALQAWEEGDTIYITDDSVVYTFNQEQSFGTYEGLLIECTDTGPAEMKLVGPPFVTEIGGSNTLRNLNFTSSVHAYMFGDGNVFEDCVGEGFKWLFIADDIEATITDCEINYVGAIVPGGDGCVLNASGCKLIFASGVCDLDDYVSDQAGFVEYTLNLSTHIYSTTTLDFDALGAITNEASVSRQSKIQVAFKVTGSHAENNENEIAVKAQYTTGAGCSGWTDVTATFYNGYWRADIPVTQDINWRGAWTLCDESGVGSCQSHTY